jgi:deoxycytidylate deaminase
MAHGIFEWSLRNGQRPTREFLHMRMALEWSVRSMCSQVDRKVGAVITSNDMRRVLSFGYNGPGRDMPNDYCATWRRQNASTIEYSKEVGKPTTVALFNSDGSLLSKCPCLHAEDNAISFVDSTIPDKRLFVTMQPCLICAQRIMNANIRHVYFLTDYRDQAGIEVLDKAKIAVYRFDLTGRYSKVTWSSTLKPTD